MKTGSSLRHILELRAAMYHKIRSFFAQRKVLEVETPLLLATTNPSPGLDNFVCEGKYLQSSPEFAMKRLLAAGSNDIYQLCKAFRKEEIGRIHQPEFTILEWYRLNFDHHQLMTEVEMLLQNLLASPPAVRYTYQEVCQKYLGLNPHTATLPELQQLARQNNCFVASLGDDCVAWLQLLFTQLIETQFDSMTPTFIYDFPINQAMLARVRPNDQVASRFELYYQGMELANGFHELNDSAEQLARFKQELAERQRLGLPTIPLDLQFLNNLNKLPDCAGVALGLDRVLLILAKEHSFDSILPFRSPDI